MGKGRIRLISTVPGPSNLSPVVREFCRRDGLVTAFSDSAVKSLADLIPEGSDAAALPFGSLARRFATLCGEMPQPVAQRGHVVAAIAAACEELSSDSPFARTASRPGLHLALTETLHEMSEFQLDPDQYEVLAETAGPELAAKLLSMASIEREAAHALQQLGRSFSREHYARCMSGAPEKGAELGRVLVLGGGDFNPAACQLLKWAARHGAKITVVTYRQASSSGLFREAEQTCAALGCEIEEAGQGNGVTQHLFSPTSASAGDVACEIVSTADPLAECEWALRGCLTRHVQGVPYERMALYVRDLVGYAPLIEAAAERLGVPIRMWRRAPLLTNSFARLTQAALAFCSSRDVRSLRAISATSYFDLDHEIRNALHEALQHAHQSRAEQWVRLRAWAEEREAYGWLVRLLDWRDDAIASPAPMEVWIGKLRDLMSLLPLQEEFARGRERDKRAQYVLHQSLNHIASIHRLRGSRSIALSEFLKLAQGIWKEADVSVPAGEHGVPVSGHAESLPAVRTLFVLGMLEGVFPRRRAEDPILTDFEREWISDHSDGPRLPNSRTRAEAERDEFYCVCASASEELVFSYPETGDERDNVPAFYLDEIDRALAGVRRTTRSRQDLTPSIDSCLAPSDRELRVSLDAMERESPAPADFSSVATVALFARDESEGLSPREIRDALLCPFSAFVRRSLELRPERLRARWFSLVRLPQAGHLSAATTSAEATMRLETALEDQLDSLYADAPEWEIALLRAGGRRLVREWVEREFSARQIWPRADLRLDVAFGDGRLRDTLPKSVKLKGRVAAMSQVGPYSVVHLTETSGPARSYGPGYDLADGDKLYYGLHLLAAWDKSAPSALEVETMAGERSLVLLPRLAGVNLTGRVQEGLKVLDLGGNEDSAGPRGFFEDVKRLAFEAIQRIEAVDVRPLKGDHCTWCDYGELCRQSLEYGEEDSPFVDDF